MTVPINFGWPQIILILIALIGVALIISLIYSILVTEKEVFELERELDEEEEEEEQEPGKRKRRAPERYVRRKRRRPRWSQGGTGIVLLILAISLLWLTFLTQTYLGLTGDIKVAQIHATAVANVPHLMSVELALFDSTGHQTSDQTYIVQGDDWMLQGDIIKFPTWMNIFGLHTGYKLTRLEGRYEQSDLERKSQHTVIDLNGGDDNFFKTVKDQGWYSSFVQAAYGNAVYIKADGRSYNIYVSQTGLFALPAS